MPRPPASRYAATISRSLSCGWFTVTSPSAQSARARAVAGADRGADQQRAGSSGSVHSLARSTVTSPSWLTSSPASSARMTSTHSRSRASRTSLRGQRLPGDVLVDASPLPSATQNRPGNIAPSVAAACAMIAGWYRWPGAFTAPNGSDVVASAAPSHDQANPECPCRALQGEKWSEHIAAVNPTSSACWTAVSSSAGWTCSCELWNPITGMRHAYRGLRAAATSAGETGPVLPPPGTPGTDLPVRSALPALADALAARRVRRARGAARHRQDDARPARAGRHACRGAIVVAEPRRVAARAAARRMAALLGEPVGGRVGYSVRGDSRRSAATRIEVVTTGLLVRRLQADPELPGVDAVVLDECHERHLDTDLALAFCLDVRAALRPDLQLLAMSATAQAQRLAALLGGDGGPAPVVEATGALHEVDVVWAPPSGAGRPAARPPGRPAAAHARRRDRPPGAGRADRRRAGLPARAPARSARSPGG